MKVIIPFSFAIDLVFGKHDIFSTKLNTSFASDFYDIVGGSVLCINIIPFSCVRASEKSTTSQVHEILKPVHRSKRELEKVTHPVQIADCQSIGSFEKRSFFELHSCILYISDRPRCFLVRLVVPPVPSSEIQMEVDKDGLAFFSSD